MSERSQFALLVRQRFLPFFLTQLLGAFNDNIYRQSVVWAIIYHLSVQGSNDLWTNVVALLFILPMLLFSALGGQLGERLDKHRLMRALKLAEILIMEVGALGFMTGNLTLMLAALFCMGAQSALFGPAKYAILPQALPAGELVGGNALVEMGTYLVILAGTIGAGILTLHHDYAWLVSGTVLLIAVGGYLASRFIPPATAALPELRISWNIPAQSWRTLRLGFCQESAVSRSLLGISWFWFIGLVYLAQAPNFAHDWMHGDASVGTLLLTVFSVGIALGSVSCGKLSGPQVELGLVPLAAMGMTLFGVLLWWHAGSVPIPATPYNWLAVMQHGGSWWILAMILLLGMAGGLYIVPLYALIQSRTPANARARVIAANNILNSLFMVLASLFSMLLLSALGWSIPQLFLVVSLLNIVTSSYLFKAVPEFMTRCKAWFGIRPVKR